MHDRKYEIKDNHLVKRSDGGPVPEDEPLFILRAKDIRALPVLVAYHALMETLEQKEWVFLTIKDFKAFQKLHPELMCEPTP